ncbi:MAG: hypothetical protein R3C05_09245 [Pirellulaceae bacterium]
MSVSSQSLRARLQRAHQPSFKLALPASITFVGVGTTGSGVVLSAFRKLREITEDRLPQNVRYLLIDADGDSRSPDSLAEQTHIRKLTLGKDGAGTALNNGFKLAQRGFTSIQKSITSCMGELMNAIDTRYPATLPPSENQAVIVVGGQGGTSGGATDLVVTAAHLASGAVGLTRLDVVHVNPGPEMAWRDVERSVDPERRQRIMANYAEVVGWRFQTMNTQLPISVLVPGRGRIRLAASSRVSSYVEFDWASETTKLQTTAELTEMMAASLLHRFFTAVGLRRASRECDDVVSGRTGQMHPLQSGVQV